MFRIHLLVALFVLLLPVAAANAGPLKISVGRDATLVNLDTGERLVRGRSVGYVRIDTRDIRRKCSKAGSAFEGLVRLEPESRNDGWTINILCLGRAAATAETGSDTELRLGKSMHAPERNETTL